MMVLEEFKHVRIVTNVLRERERWREREREHDSCIVVRGKIMTGSRRRRIKMIIVLRLVSTRPAC